MPRRARAGRPDSRARRRASSRTPKKTRRDGVAAGRKTDEPEKERYFFLPELRKSSLAVPGSNW